MPGLSEATALLPQLGSLAGTLTGDQVLSQMEQLGRAQVEHLIQQRQEAEKAASQAEGAYTQAAAQAPPDVAPGEQLVTSLFGNIASTLAQDPRFRQSAQDRILSQRNALLKARSENLVALRDAYQQRASELERIGDPAALDLRLKMDQLDKQREQLLEKMKLDARAEEGRLDRANALELERLRQSGRMTEAMLRLSFEQGEADDQVYSDATAVIEGQASLKDFPQKKRSAIIRNIQARGEVILPPKVRDSVGALGSALDALGQIEGLVFGGVDPETGEEQPGVLTSEGGLFANIGQAARVELQARSQDSPQAVRAAVFMSLRQGLLSAISRSTGEVGVLTDRDVIRARNLLPGPGDSVETAKSKAYQLRQFLRARQFNLKRAYTTAGAGIIAPEQSESAPAQGAEASGDTAFVRDANGKLVAQ